MKYSLEVLEIFLLSLRVSFFSVKVKTGWFIRNLETSRLPILPIQAFKIINSTEESLTIRFLNYAVECPRF